MPPTPIRSADNVARILPGPFALAGRSDEIAVTRGAYEDLHAYYWSHLADAKKLLEVGEAKRDASLDPAEHATWTMLVNHSANGRRSKRDRQRRY